MAMKKKAKTATKRTYVRKHAPQPDLGPQYGTETFNRVDQRMQEAEMSIGRAMANRTYGNEMTSNRAPNQIDLLTDQVEALKAKVLELELELLAFYRRTYGAKSVY